MIAGTVFAILVSAALVWMLGMRDPKRLRNQPAHGPGAVPAPMSAGLRRLIGWLVPVPGLVLIAVGQWWAFLIWLGAMCVAGWVASRLLAIRSPDTRAEL